MLFLLNCEALLCARVNVCLRMLLSNLIEVEVEVEVDKIPFVNYSFILYIVCLSISLPGTLLHKIKTFFSDYYLVYLRGIYVKTRNSFVSIFGKFADFLLFQHDFLNQRK